MYIHVSKCKNDKINFHDPSGHKNLKTKLLWVGPTLAGFTVVILGGK
jgi:hypothetical protein